MRKITFEKAVLVVFILIILISTSETTGKYIAKGIDRFKKGSEVQTTNTSTVKSIGFTTMLQDADNLFKEGNYEAAADAYYAKTLTNTLSPEQKIHAYFNLGVCQYNMQNYERALDSFSRVTSFNPDDSVAYNNAAVSAYRSNNLSKAIELQQKAVSIQPAVEYFYNIARMYEDNSQFKLAAENYLRVAIGEQNLTKSEKIDPVRVKEKLARLKYWNAEIDSKSANNVRIGLRLEDSRDIFTINENKMQLQQGDFTVKVENQKDAKNIVAEYNRKKYDPYNLISELIWTIYKDGKAIYKKSSDKINYVTKDSGNYEIRLSIRHNGNNEKISKKIVRISQYNSSVGTSIQDNITVKAPVETNTKTYSDAIYEQLFENDFPKNGNQYVDRYNVTWGKDDIDVALNKKQVVDKSSSLLINNTSGNSSGIWVNLDSLVKEHNLQGRTIKIGFYARKLTNNAHIELITRVRSENSISATQQYVALNSKWEQSMHTVYLPPETTGFTVSIKTKPGEQLCIDGFTLVD